MSSEDSSFAGHYIHGYSPEEQARLRAQAKVLAPAVIDSLKFSPHERVLELGCGVGAELDLLHQGFPDLQLTGIEIDPRHLASARGFLPPEITLLQGDARNLPFEDNTFDTVLTIWVLEHLTYPEEVLREALRVLKPGGRLICTEVDNATMNIAGEFPTIETWWERFNTNQLQAGGNPFVGRDLHVIAQQAGASNVEVELIKPVSSSSFPERTEEFLGYLEDLYLSAAEHLHESKSVTAEIVDALRSEFAEARINPDTHCEYHAVRLTCTNSPN